MARMFTLCRVARSLVVGLSAQPLPTTLPSIFTPATGRAAWPNISGAPSGRAGGTPRARFVPLSSGNSVDGVDGRDPD